MKLLSTLKKASPLLLLPFANNALATDVTVPLTFETLPVITITEVQPIVFGNVLPLAQAASCVMEADPDTHRLTTTEEGKNIVDGGTSGLTAGAFSGGCAGEPDGQPGIYEIASFAGADLTVSVTAGTATDIAFAPLGYAVNHDSPSTTANTNRVDLSVGTDANVKAASALTAFTQAGRNRVVIGGTVTNQNALTAGADYTTDFNLNVVYQ
jgi:hypothetical protein